MTWPTGAIDTAGMDAGTDTPPRAAILDMAQKVNQMIATPPAASSSDTLRIDVASASTVNLTTSAPDTRHINITGTTSIAGFVVAAGLTYFVRFAGALTLTNSAGLVTQTGANIITAAGDTCIIRSTAADTVEILSYVVGVVPAVAGGITIGSPISITSGSSINLGTISATAKRFEIHLKAVTMNANSAMGVRIGSGGAVVTAGYSGASMLGTTGSSISTIFGFSVSAAAPYTGKITIAKLSSTYYEAVGMVYNGNNLVTTYAGFITLAAQVDIMTFVSTTGSFTGGQVILSWE